MCVAVIRVDYGDVLPVAVEMSQNKRQSPAADRTEADHHDRAIPGGIDGPVGHDRTSLQKRIDEESAL